MVATAPDAPPGIPRFRIFIAVLNRRDRHHEQAMALFAGETPHWFTSRLVWSETYSWFLHRHG
jgi:predicted nucleic acid-binding protein